MVYFKIGIINHMNCTLYFRTATDSRLKNLSIIIIGVFQVRDDGNLLYQ